MTVYADVLFLVNFSLDFVTLYITGRLMSLSLSLLRLCVSASVGAFFAVLALVFDMNGILYMSLSLFVCLLMCILAYRQKGAVENISSAVLAFTVGSALGGAMTALYSLGEGYRQSLSDRDRDDSGAVILLIAVLALSAVSLGCRAAKRRIGAVRCKVIIADGGASCELWALCDSGSFLREPISGRSALIVRAEAVKEILPPEIVNTSLDAVSAIAEIPPLMLSKVRLLPVKSVTGEGMMLGYHPDSVTLINGKKHHSADCYIALSNGKNGFSGCDAIVPSELL